MRAQPEGVGIGVATSRHFPVRAGPTKHTASWERDASMFMGSTMYGVSAADQGPT